MDFVKDRTECGWQQRATTGDDDGKVADVARNEPKSQWVRRYCKGG